MLGKVGRRGGEDARTFEYLSGRGARIGERPETESDVEAFGH
jgi:hypothetical protein